MFTKVGGEVVLSGGERLPYSRLLIATGSVPRKLGVPGQDLEGVETLRCGVVRKRNLASKCSF